MGKRIGIFGVSLEMSVLLAILNSLFICYIDA